MHTPVLLEEVVDLLQVKPNGFYVDGTLGLGGHAEAIVKQLTQNGRLLGLDVDPKNLKEAEHRLQPLGNLTLTRQVNFRGLQGVLRELDWKEVDGMLFDLGISSVQLDDAARGFTFRESGPLDMRLNPDSPETALSVLQKIDEKRLEEVLRDFGEPMHARRLSHQILRGVASGSLKTTQDLAFLCESIVWRHRKTHPATRVFLALRCLVNQEMEALREMLEVAPAFLKTGGRLAIISFHSIEDRMVKERYRQLENEGLDSKKFQQITPKPLTPSEEEKHKNPRSRSAKLRVLERVL